jgi:hypothetical protein
MQITLQRNNSDDRKFTKSIDTLASLSGSLRDGSSIIDPVILIEGNISSLANCNYMTIPEFSRSYFVTDITSIRNNLIQITGHVDVLSTYRDAILANTGIIRRQEGQWNLYLDDGTFKVYNNPIILTRAFPSGFSTMSFILAVAGS